MSRKTLTAEDQALLDRVNRLSPEEIEALPSKDMHDYFAVIDKIDPHAVRHAIEEALVEMGATNADVRRWGERARWKH